MKLQVGIFIPKSEVSLVNFHSIYVVLVCLFFWLICCQLNLSSWWCCTRNNMTKNLIQFCRIKVRVKKNRISFQIYYIFQSQEQSRTQIWSPRHLLLHLFTQIKRDLSPNTVLTHKKKIFIVEIVSIKK